MTRVGPIRTFGEFNINTLQYVGDTEGMGYFIYCEYLTCKKKKKKIVRPEQPVAVFYVTFQELV